MSLKHDIEFTLNGVQRKRDGRRHDERPRHAARGGRPHRHQVRLRRGRMRRLHHPGRRRLAELLPDVRRRLPRPQRHHHRGPHRPPRGDALRDAFVEHGAVQCGFCTPGMMMQADHLLRKHEHPDDGLRQARHRGQPVPLHRLQENRRRRGRLRRTEAKEHRHDRRRKETPCHRTRFADRQAHPEDGCARKSQRQDALHPRHQPVRASCTARSCAPAASTP
jgi:hypothetical protein